MLLYRITIIENTTNELQKDIGGGEGGREGGYTFSTSIYREGGGCFVDSLLLATLVATGGIALGGGMAPDPAGWIVVVGLFCVVVSGDEIFSSFFLLLPFPLKYIF